LGSPITLVIRSQAGSAALIPALRRAVLAADPEQPVTSVRTMEQVVDSSLARRRFSALLLTGFAALALLLAAIGLYGVVSYSVTQRTQEMGLRLALGATRAEVFRLVLGESMFVSAAGVAAGLVAAFLVTGLLSNQLYGLSSADPSTFFAVAALLAAVSATASILPARRATAVDPLVALRHE
jgi:putative ABC transport system permease protein